MTAIDIARKLAALNSVKEAQEAYNLVIHQGGAPEEQLEAAVYILRTGGDYKISYTCLCTLYNQGHFQEQILPLMIGAFYEPNIEDLRSRYERNCKLLKKYSYLFRKDFLPFDELPVWFFPYDDDGYVPFYPDRRRFGEYINFKNPVVSRNFFHDLENPILADDVYSQYELEYLIDNVRRSEDVGRENHVYLHYTDWPVFCAHLQCLEMGRVVKDKKAVFLIGEEIRRYPIDFMKEYGIDYSRNPVKPVGIREINRLIWHTQLSYHNGGDFFNEIFDAHPNLLVLPSVMMSNITKSVKEYEDALNSAKNLRQALDMFQNWPQPKRVEELYRMKGRTSKDMMVAVYLQNKMATTGLDPNARIVPAVFLQPHFSHMPAGLGVDTEKDRAVLDMPTYEEIKNSPMFLSFKYIKTFTPMRRFTVSHGASVRFMYKIAMAANEDPNSRKKKVVNDALTERVLNRSFMADPEDRLFKDSVVVRLEDGKLNPKATFTALAAFLDLPYTESMTRCTESGAPRDYGGRIKDGFDPAPVYKTYDEYVNDAERYFIEYCLRDAYEYYGYDFQYYDGAPVDEAKAEELIQGFTTMDYYIRDTWKRVFDVARLSLDGQVIAREDMPEDETEIRKALLEKHIKTIQEKRMKNTKILLRGLRFVNRHGQPLRMMRKLEPDPALLEQPVYH